ncbi:MAG: c-type cytochrome [Rhodobacteraceae bacterium]|nr:c-type cytochrome [Paracoccaceae bacterium]
MHKFALIFCFASSMASTAFAEGDYDNGKKLAKSWHCTNCHGVTGNERWPVKGEVLASIPMLAGQPAGYLIRTLNQYKTRERVDDHEISKMSERAQSLSDQDIEDISAYFSAQKRY